jgi:hypothetical protein
MATLANISRQALSPEELATSYSTTMPLAIYARPLSQDRALRNAGRIGAYPARS